MSSLLAWVGFVAIVQWQYFLKTWPLRRRIYIYTYPPLTPLTSWAFTATAVPNAGQSCLQRSSESPAAATSRSKRLLCGRGGRGRDRAGGAPRGASRAGRRWESRGCCGWGHWVRASAAPNPIDAWHLQLTSPSLPSSDQLSGRPLRACRLRGGGGAAVVCGVWCGAVWCSVPVAWCFRSLCLVRIRWTTIRG